MRKVFFLILFFLFFLKDLFPKFLSSMDSSSDIILRIHLSLSEVIFFCSCAHCALEPTLKKSFFFILIKCNFILIKCTCRINQVSSDLVVAIVSSSFSMVILLLRSVCLIWFEPTSLTPAPLQKEITTSTNLIFFGFTDMVSLVQK